MESLRLLIGGALPIFAIIASIIVILIIREIVMWYWKINKIVHLLEEQNSLLRKLNQD
jgi:hypothetical protein